MKQITLPEFSDTACRKAFEEMQRDFGANLRGAAQATTIGDLYLNYRFEIDGTQYEETEFYQRIVDSKYRSKNLYAHSLKLTSPASANHTIPTSLYCKRKEPQPWGPQCAPLSCWILQPSTS